MNDDPVDDGLTDQTRSQLDKLVGLAMLLAASFVFIYYSIWTLLMVRFIPETLSPTG